MKVQRGELKLVWNTPPNTDWTWNDRYTATSVMIYINKCWGKKLVLAYLYVWVGWKINNNW